MLDRPTSASRDKVVHIRTRRPILARRPAPEQPQAMLPGHDGTDGAESVADDFRHRMIVNVIAFGFVAMLVMAALWLADALATMRKDQDCVLSGRRGCSPVETPLKTL